MLFLCISIKNPKSRETVPLKLFLELLLCKSLLIPADVPRSRYSSGALTSYINGIPKAVGNFLRKSA
jgi:hypothetical protein